MNKKTIIGIGVLIAILLGVWWWPKTEEEEVVVRERKLEEPTPEFVMDSPEVINWKISETKSYPEMEVYLVERRKYTESEKVLIKTALTGGNLTGKQHYKFDDNRDKYEYSLNIENGNEIETGEQGENEVKNLFYELGAKIREINGNWEIKVERTSYKQFSYPWWISGTKDDHAVIELEAEYTLNSVPIRTFGGYPIIADYSSGGKLVKIQGQLPYGQVVKSSKKRLITQEEMQNRNTNGFKVWKVEGGKEYELAEEQPVIKQVDVYDYSLGYIYDFKSGVVWPFYFLKGNTQLSTGPAKVILITSAVKE